MNPPTVEFTWIKKRPRAAALQDTSHGVFAHSGHVGGCASGGRDCPRGAGQKAWEVEFATGDAEEVLP